MFLSLSTYLKILSFLPSRNSESKRDRSSLLQKLSDFYASADFLNGFHVKQTLIRQYSRYPLFSPLLIKGLIVNICFDEYLKSGHVSFLNQLLFKLYVYLSRSKLTGQSFHSFKKNLVIIAPTANAEQLFSEFASSIKFNQATFEIARLNSSASYDLETSNYPTTVTYYNKQTLQTITRNSPGFVPNANHILLKSVSPLASLRSSVSKNVYRISKFCKPLTGEYNGFPHFLLSLIDYKFDNIYTFGFDLQLQVTRSPGYSLYPTSKNPSTSSDYKKIFIHSSSSLQHDPSDQFMILFLLYKLNHFRPDSALMKILDSGILSYLIKLSSIYS